VTNNSKLEAQSAPTYWQVQSNNNMDLHSHLQRCAGLVGILTPKDRKAPRGLLKVEKCKLDEIVPKKPKFAGRVPWLFLRDGSNGFSDRKMMKNWIFGEFFEKSVKVSLYHTLWYLIVWRLQSPISFFLHLIIWRKRIHMRVIMFFTCGKNLRCFGALLSNPISA
jgi:hypothetical protein